MPKHCPREFRDDLIRFARNPDPDVQLKTIEADFGISGRVQVVTATP